MEIKEITDKNEWEGFMEKCQEKTFLDSWNWGEFQKKQEEKIWRLGIYDSELIAAVLVVKIKAKRGTFLFVPHGPSVALAKEGGPKVKSEVLEILTEKLKEIAKQEKASFIRIAPIWPADSDNIKLFKNLNFINAPIHMHPELTWEIDISLSEEEILRSMRKTTRYLIRQAEQNPEISIEKSRNIDDLKIFNKIYSETAKRHNFSPFSLKYLQSQFSCFSPDNQILILLGKYKKEVVSSAVAVFWQNIGFYHHGASLSKYNKIPVSYLSQWEAIKEAKNRGCLKYNFWGITPILRKHPWAGLTLFKKGFGGYPLEYVKTQDLPLSKKYYLTFAFEKFRKFKRGL